MPHVLDSRELDKFCIRTERGAELLKESVEYMPDYAKVAFEEDQFQYLSMIYYMDRCIDRCMEAGIPNMEDTISLYEKKRVMQIMSVCGNDFFAGIETILKQYIGVETEKPEDIFGFGSSFKLESAHFACFERICNVEFPDAEMLRSYHTICLAVYLANQEKYNDRFAARLIARGGSLDIAAWVVKKAYSQNPNRPLLPEREAYIKKLKEQYDSGENELSFESTIPFGHGFSVRFLTPYICNRLTAQDCAIEGIESEEKELLLVFPIEMPEENSTGMRLGGDDVGNIRFCYEGQENIDAGLLFAGGGYLNRVFSLSVPDGEEKILGKKISVSIETPVGTVKQDLVIGQEISVNMSMVSAGDILKEAQRAIDKRLYGYAYRLLSRGEHSPELDALRDSLQKKLEPYNCNCNVISCNGPSYDGHLEITNGFGVHVCHKYAESYVELYGIIDSDQKEHMAIGYIQARPRNYEAFKKLELGEFDPYYGQNPDRKQFWFLREYENKKYYDNPVIEEGAVIWRLDFEDSRVENSRLDIWKSPDVTITDCDSVWLLQLGDTRIELESGTVKEAYLRTCRQLAESIVATNRDEYGLGIPWCFYFIGSIEEERAGEHEYEALYEDSVFIRTDLSPSDMADNTLRLARFESIPYVFRWFRDKEGTQMLLEYIPEERTDFFSSDDSLDIEEDLFADFDFDDFDDCFSDNHNNKDLSLPKIQSVQCKEKNDSISNKKYEEV
jgi:hypothetical protein